MIKRNFLLFNSAATFLTCVCIFLFHSDHNGYNYNYYESALLFLLGLLIYFYYLLRQEKYKRSSLFTLPTTFLLISAFIVNFQTPINVLLEIAPIHYYLDTTKYSEYLGKVIYIGIIAIVSFMLGYINYKVPISKHCETKEYYLGERVWLALTIFSFIFFLINIDIKDFISGSIYFGSGANDRKTTISSYWENIFDVFNTITIGTYVFISSQREEKFNFQRFISIFPIGFLAINIVYLILRTLSGDRGPLLYTFMTFFFSYIYLNKKKINIIIIFAFFITAIFFTSMLNVYRGQDNSTSLQSKIQSSIKYKKDRIEGRTISPYTQELSNSINCTFIAISDIDTEKTSFQNGLYNLCELFLSIPGSNFIYKSITGFDLWRYNTPEYITTSFYGKEYPFGLGTTAIADFYLDTGIIGVILGFFLSGILFKFTDHKLTSWGNISIIELLFFLKISSMSIYIPRASFSYVITKAIYICIVYIIIRKLLSLFFYQSHRQKIGI